jgi:ethanolamine ammonia-lyase small subunit
VPDHTPARTTSSPTPQLSHPARLSLGNASPTISTRDNLAFQLDHALARDAVHTPLDHHALLEGLSARGLSSVTLQSAAPDRRTYLRRPDLGRTLAPASIEALKHLETPSLAPETGTEAPTHAPRIALVLADGLSALALERRALPLLDALLPLLLPTSYLLPVALATNARVAIGDPIGELIHADMTILLIGERPGLSSPDSLGCYLTWAPRPGRTDAERNCISNLRGDAGLSYNEAAHRIAHYLREALRLQTSGTALKDPTSDLLAKP